MFVVRKTPLRPGVNHISLPLGAEVLDVDDALRLTFKCLADPPGLENRVFLTVMTEEDLPEIAGKDWRYIASVTVFHVFELVAERAPRRVTGDQLVGEGR